MCLPGRGKRGDRNFYVTITTAWLVDDELGQIFSRKAREGNESEDFAPRDLRLALVVLAISLAMSASRVSHARYHRYAASIT